MTENVRKVFDMLGVEPNEEFEVLCDNIPFSSKCKIDEHLQGYFFAFGGWEFFDELLKDLLNGSNTIIKLPKKKHVGDKKCNDMKENCLICPLRAFDCPKIEMDMLDKDLCMAQSTLYEIFEHIEYLKEDKEIYNLVKARLDKEVEE